MNLTYYTVLTVLPFLFSMGLCALQALKPGIIPDKPNHRSSHSKVVSRGGGLAFVLPAVFFIAYRVLTESQADRGLTGLLAGMVCFALLGLFDDVRNLSSSFRLIAQFIVAAAVVLYGTEDRIDLFNYYTAEGWIVRILQILWIPAVINFYNFMDGIDGIAALQGLFVSAAAALFLQLDIQNIAQDANGEASGSIYALSVLRDFHVVLIAGLLGFLFWNKPRAKLFMGDSGSYFLGFVFAYAALMAASPSTRNGGEILSIGISQSGLMSSFSLYFMLLLPFIADPVTTLFRKSMKKIPIFHAHREHLYQLMHRSGWSAISIDLIYLLFNITLLFPALLFLLTGSGLMHAATAAVMISMFLGLIFYLGRRFG